MGVYGCVLSHLPKILWSFTIVWASLLTPSPAMTPVALKELNAIVFHSHLFSSYFLYAWAKNRSRHVFPSTNLWAWKILNIQEIKSSSLNVMGRAHAFLDCLLCLCSLLFISETLRNFEVENLSRDLVRFLIWFSGWYRMSPKVNRSVYTLRGILEWPFQ